MRALVGFVWTVVLLIVAGCGDGSPAAPSVETAKLTFTVVPNPARVGMRPVLTIREGAGVGVTATKVVRRRYDAGGAQLSEDTFTGHDAWFACDNTTEETMPYLAANGACTLTQSTREVPSQLEFDQYVTDDNGHDLTFTSPRMTTIP
jgi:hypothetical protein